MQVLRVQLLLRSPKQYSEVIIMIKVNLDGLQPMPVIDYEAAYKALNTLWNKNGKGSEFTGWVELPITYDRDEFRKIQETAQSIREKAEVFIVIGIGGSYLGARAAIEMLKSPRHNEEPDGPKVYFLGNGLSGEDIAQVLRLADGKDVFVNVISKSGTTLEPAVAFRIVREYMQKRYGDDGCRERIIATTDKKKGVLKELADQCGYRTFVVPDDIGGRYSVLTPVGLLPMAVAGINIQKVMTAACHAMKGFLKFEDDNPAAVYAAARQALYTGSRKKVEILSYPGESMRFMAEWWKQLYGESEGKEHLGIFPASCELTADLHSLGQYIQDGERILFETILRFENCSEKVFVPEVVEDPDKLNYIAGMDYADIYKAAAAGVKKAHITGGVPVIEIIADRQDEEGFGELVAFYELACGISGYMEGVNPFDQPGVEEYKKNMFALLGRK